MIMVMSPIALANNPFEKISTTQETDVTVKVQTLGSQVATIVQVVGYAVAVVMVIWLGVQYVIATPAKKAELKGKLWSMAIGVVLIVCGVTILGLVAQAGNTVVGEL